MKYKLDKQNSTAEHTYRQEKKRVNSLMSDKMNEYYRSEFTKNKGNIKGTWNVIEKILPKKKRDEGAMHDGDLSIRAEKFNKYFSEVGENAFNKSQEHISHNPNLTFNHASLANCTSNFRPQPIDINSLILIIKHLKPTNSFGSDGMPYRFIIDSLPITIFYNL